MDFVAIETPASRVPAAGETLELLDAALRIVVGDGLKIVPNQLVEALAECLGPLAGAFDKLLIDRKSDIHMTTVYVHTCYVSIFAMRTRRDSASARLERITAATVDSRIEV
jgi:hypothetical protein